MTLKRSVCARGSVPHAFLVAPIVIALRFRSEHRRLRRRRRGAPLLEHIVVASDSACLDYAFDVNVSDSDDTDASEAHESAAARAHGRDYEMPTGSQGLPARACAPSTAPPRPPSHTDPSIPAHAYRPRKHPHRRRRRGRARDRRALPILRPLPHCRHLPHHVAVKG
ncbi:hypothetical protein GGX14DRAFT_407393 [Mycena pura]|uniref:Uncharacterized protein n=1 Tax=Mycena pura TaxID=153505 RepID=A0AAD6XX81_9AGAR|nr:hypothetical protein GGX14DRAFT_407393 [Mycena pura]